MVNLGKLAKTAKKIADTHGDKIASAVDKATDAVDKQTKGKYGDKLKKLDEMATKLDKTRRPDGNASTDAGEEVDPS